ncbi:phage major capsid protein, partial [Acetobacter sp. DsW_063]|uniref:phage major capsid protein n=1 Tax=Acetobacter sp. DsW_063 TaxID=1514894 RepID=UPI000A398E09
QRYVFANPTGVAGPVLWGLPVAQSLAMAAGAFMTGAFRYAAQIFDREDATVTISSEDGDNVRKGMVTIVGEERLALAVYRPEALIKGSFADLTTAAAGSGA